MKYRNMEIDDYDSIIALWQRVEGICVRDADSKEGIEKYLIRNLGLSFVAIKDESLIGTIMSGHDGKRGYIQHLAVEVELQRQGIGRNLLDICLQALCKEGIVKSHIHVLRGNENGASFWLKNGWFKRDDIDLYSYINGGPASA